MVPRRTTSWGICDICVIWHRSAKSSDVPSACCWSAILMWRLDRSRLWAVPGVAATALLSGLAADGVKMLIARARPHQFRLPRQRVEQLRAVAALGFVGQCEPELSFGPHGHRRRPGHFSDLHLSGRTRAVLCFAAAGCLSADGQRGAFPQRRALRGGRGMSRGGHDLDVPVGSTSRMPSGFGGEWGRASRAAATAYSSRSVVRKRHHTVR